MSDSNDVVVVDILAGVFRTRRAINKVKLAYDGKDVEKTAGRY